MPEFVKVLYTLGGRSAPPARPPRRRGERVWGAWEAPSSSAPPAASMSRAPVFVSTIHFHAPAARRPAPPASAPRRASARLGAPPRPAPPRHARLLPRRRGASVGGSVGGSPRSRLGRGSVGSAPRLGRTGSPSARRRRAARRPSGSPAAGGGVGGPGGGCCTLNF